MIIWFTILSNCTMKELTNFAIKQNVTRYQYSISFSSTQLDGKIARGAEKGGAPEHLTITCTSKGYMIRGKPNIFGNFLEQRNARLFSWSILINCGASSGENINLAIENKKLARKAASFEEAISAMTTVFNQ